MFRICKIFVEFVKSVHEWHGYVLLTGRDLYPKCFLLVLSPSLHLVAFLDFHGLQNAHPVPQGQCSMESVPALVAQETSSNSIAQQVITTTLQA